MSTEPEHKHVSLLSLKSQGQLSTKGQHVRPRGSIVEEPWKMTSKDIKTAFAWWSKNGKEISRQDILTGLSKAVPHSFGKKEIKLIGEGGKEGMTLKQLTKLIEGFPVEKGIFNDVFQVRFS